MEKAYTELGLEVSWPELADANKAIDTKEWKIALASIKDVLRFVLRYDLHTTPNQLLDPSIWQDTDEVELTESLEEALKIVFN